MATLSDLDFDFSQIVTKEKAEDSGKSALDVAKEKIEHDDADTIAYGELMVELTKLPQMRINAAMKRLTPNQLLTLECAIKDCKEESKNRALERTKLLMSQMGLSKADVINYLSNDESKPAKKEKTGKVDDGRGKPLSADRKWVKKLQEDLYAFYDVDSKHLEMETKEVLAIFIDKYPDATGSDISRIKYRYKNK